MAGESYNFIRAMLYYYSQRYCVVAASQLSIPISIRNGHPQSTVEGHKVMGKLNPNHLGTLLPGSPENRRFCGLFGVSAQAVVDAWRWMDVHGLLPNNPQLCHFLWALAFMCIYPRMTKHSPVY